MNKASKIIAILVAFIMVAAFSACNSDKAAEPTATKDSSTTAKATEETTESPTEEPKQPVELTIAAVNGNQDPGIMTDPVAEEVTAQTGVTLNWIGNAVDKMSVLLASGDLPDILGVDANFVKQLIDGKQIIALDDLVATNGQNIMDNAPHMISYSKTYMSDDTNSLYFLSALMDEAGEVGATFNPWIRWDYYKELGYPEVNNHDDLFNVLKQMVVAHPTNEDGKKTYITSGFMDWGVIFCFWSGYLETAAGGAGNLLSVDIVSGDTQDMLYDDNSVLWTGSLFFNRAQREGILDPETFTQTHDVFSGKCTDNRYMMVPFSWMVQGNNVTFQSNGSPKAVICRCRPFPARAHTGDKLLPWATQAGTGVFQPYARLQTEPWTSSTISGHMKDAGPRSTESRACITTFRTAYSTLPPKHWSRSRRMRTSKTRRA